MELAGIGFGILTAILWGSADTIAAMAARRLGTFKTTFVSQSAGFLALFLFGAIAYVFLPLPFTKQTVAVSMFLGILTGSVAAFGYFYFYRALETGPIALVSPLTSTSSVFTLLLSLFILRQGLTVVQLGAVLIIILGVLMASTNAGEIHTLLRTPGYAFFGKGVRWALIATLAFGVMDFGIGASATLSGWFLPVLWTRIFSICALTLISYWKRHQRMKRLQTASTAPLRTEEAAPSVMSAAVSPALADIAPPGNLDSITDVDPDATVIARISPRQHRPEAFDPDATVIRRPSRRPETLASASKSSSTLRLLETSLEDTLIIRPFRSYSTLLTVADNASPQRREELNHIDTLLLSQNTAPLGPREEEEALASNPGERTLSLSLPTLEELAHLRVPLASTLGMGVLLAIIAGIAENAAVLSFSLDTQLATTGIASAIASGYSLIVILFGIIIYHERLTWNQIAGIITFMSGLIFLVLIK